LSGKEKSEGRERERERERRNNIVINEKKDEKTSN
jgi:hypothetical protein